MAQRMKRTGQIKHPKYQHILKVIAQQQALRTEMKQPLAQLYKQPMEPYQPPGPAPATIKHNFTNEQLKTLQEQIQSYTHLLHRQRARDVRVTVEQRKNAEMQIALSVGYPSKGSTVST